MDKEGNANSFAVGTDRLFFKDGDLVIHSPCDMVDWRATKYRKTAVIFRMQRYYVARKSRLGDGTFRYTLKLWLDEHSDLPARTVEYDEEYVAQRDDIYGQYKRQEKISLFLRAALPLLGFLPSSMKAKLQDMYGVEPVAMTSYSIFLEYLLMLVTSYLYVIHMFTRVFPRWFDYIPVAVIVVLIDAIIRYHNVLEEAAYPFGFFEWIFRMRLK